MRGSVELGPRGSAHGSGLQGSGRWSERERGIRKSLYRYGSIGSDTRTLRRSLSGGQKQEGYPWKKKQSRGARTRADVSLSERALEEPPGRLSWLCQHLLASADHTTALLGTNVQTQLQFVTLQGARRSEERTTASPSAVPEAAVLQPSLSALHQAAGYTNPALARRRLIT